MPQNWVVWTMSPEWISVPRILVSAFLWWSVVLLISLRTVNFAFQSVESIVAPTKAIEHNNRLVLFLIMIFQISIICSIGLLRLLDAADQLIFKHAKQEVLFPYFSSLFISPHKLTCSLWRNSCPLSFLWSPLGTVSQPSIDWMHDKLLSSLPDESWSSESVGISLLGVDLVLGLPGGEAEGEFES